PGATLTVHEIKRHCAQHLEPYMVPRLVEIRESLPLTGSGKIDRRALRTASAGAAR
ncbi:MAG: fatty-acid--CoA ligase, partial [Acidobacteria bacterium]